MVEKDLTEDLINEFGENSDIVISMTKFMETEHFYELEIGEFEGLEISYSKEKINTLQYNICVDIEHGENNIELLFEDGINNGTQLNEYTINPKTSFTNDVRYYNELIGFELDMDTVNSLASNGKADDCFILKAQTVLDNITPKLKKLHREQSYDNYVTGGGTTKTDRFYDEKLNELSNGTVFWRSVYNQIEYNAQFN
mgnify:CR=1 FL=1